MHSALERAKRALVNLIKQIAPIYGVTTSIDRTSPDAAVKAAYRKLSKKSHPDRGGNVEHQKSLNVAYEMWEKADKEKAKPGAPPSRSNAASSNGSSLATVRERKYEDLK